MYLFQHSYVTSIWIFYCCCHLFWKGKKTL